MRGPDSVSYASTSRSAKLPAKFKLPYGGDLERSLDFRLGVGSLIRQRQPLPGSLAVALRLGEDAADSESEIAARTGAGPDRASWLTVDTTALAGLPKPTAGPGSGTSRRRRRRDSDG